MKNTVGMILEQYEFDSDYPKMKRDLLILFGAIKEENKLLNFMVENGLGEEDFKNDITLPTDI